MSNSENLREKALHFLNTNHPLPDDELVITDCIEKLYGVIFFYDSKKRVSGESDRELVGNVPLLVLHEGGKFYHLGIFWEKDLAFIEARLDKN